MSNYTASITARRGNCHKLLDLMLDVTISSVEIHLCVFFDVLLLLVDISAVGYEIRLFVVGDHARFPGKCPLGGAKIVQAYYRTRDIYRSENCLSKSDSCIFAFGSWS